MLRSALALWRGTPLADLEGLQFAQAEIHRLEELRLTAIEARVDADLGRGREAELVGELQRLVAAYPTRERLAKQLMLALYRRGRQADALEAYRETRRVLVEAARACGAVAPASCAARTASASKPQRRTPKLSLEPSHSLTPTPAASRCVNAGTAGRRKRSRSAAIDVNRARSGGKSSAGRYSTAASQRAKRRGWSRTFNRKRVPPLFNALVSARTSGGPPAGARCQ
jgi:DNA-binding SARP family transcriptional activator